MKKEDFKVYSNPDIKGRMEEDYEEVTFDLEIPDEDTITALFLSSPYFISMMREQGMFYYPVDLSAEETFMAPLLSKDVFWDFVEESKRIRMKEKIPLAPLLHLPVEDEDGDEDMIGLFDGLIQMEFTKFFQTAVMVTNVDAALADEFDDVYQQLLKGLEENGYLDQVMVNIAEIMDNPDMIAALLFPEEDDE